MIQTTAIAIKPGQLWRNIHNGEIIQILDVCASDESNRMIVLFQPVDPDSPARGKLFDSFVLRFVRLECEVC